MKVNEDITLGQMLFRMDRDSKVISRIRQTKDTFVLEMV